MKYAFRLTLYVFLFCLLSQPCYAHPSAEDHNKELESVLFERGYSKYKPGVKEYIKAIEYASYLCIDQFGGKGEEQYRALKQMRMGGLPLSFSALDYSYDLSGGGKQITARTHRLITHQGWEQTLTKNANSFWATRKRILLGTLNSIFDFGVLSSAQHPSKSCNALAAIIYYTHILGDYDEAKSAKNEFAIMIDLAGRNDGLDIITQLREYSSVLFQSQKNAVPYKNLMKDFDSIEKRAKKILRAKGGISDEKNFEEYHLCANDLMDSLKKNVPELLKNETFFKEVFYKQ